MDPTLTTKESSDDSAFFNPQQQHNSSNNGNVNGQLGGNANGTDSFTSLGARGLNYNAISH
eukprot:14702151-Ditylum_brightwellii.AAC.1